MVGPSAGRAQTFSAPMGAESIFVTLVGMVGGRMQKRFQAMQHDAACCAGAGSWCKIRDGTPIDCS